MAKKWGASAPPAPLVSTPLVNPGSSFPFPATLVSKNPVKLDVVADEGVLQ